MEHCHYPCERGERRRDVNACHHKRQEKDDEYYFIRDGIVVIPKGVLIRSGTVI
jgi:hypothetical protein